MQIDEKVFTTYKKACQAENFILFPEHAREKSFHFFTTWQMLLNAAL